MRINLNLCSDMSVNKIMKMINGNINRNKNIIKIAMWNCRRGLVNSDKCASHKVAKIKHFLYSENIHVLGVVEADLHSSKSRFLNRQKLTTDEVHNILKIEGYILYLPKCWQVHGQARIVMYVKNNVSTKIKDVSLNQSDLQTMTCEVGFGKGKKTIVNFFYREFTGAVSGLNDKGSQKMKDL